MPPERSLALAGRDEPARGHDPRVDRPTPSDRRRAWLWLLVLGFSPLCIGVAVWAALDLNAAYPTVAPPVPPGWQAVKGIYASFSVPGPWSLQSALSDEVGDICYTGRGGGAGESVTASARPPSGQAPLPKIVGVFLQEPYRVTSLGPYRLANAAVAWRYRLRLRDGTGAIALHAWARATQTDVWLVAWPSGPTALRVLQTLTLAS